MCVVLWLVKLGLVRHLSRGHCSVQIKGSKAPAVISVLELASMSERGEERYVKKPHTNCLSMLCKQGHA